MFTQTPFNIVDVYKGISDRKRRRRETFKVVLKMCHNQIRMAAARDMMRCSYMVPGFIAGLPTFNMTDCVTFVKQALETNGFVAHCLFPNIIIVSWDIDDLEKRDNPSVMALEYTDKHDPDKNLLLEDINDRKLLQDSAHTVGIVKKKNSKFVLHLK